MGIDSQDTDVLQLLKKLKDTNSTYPQELLAARRQGYLQQVAQVSAGLGLTAALKTTVKSAPGAGSLPTAGTLLEGLLVVAIVAEASTVAYFYRDKIAQFIQNRTNTPKVEQVVNPPVFSSPVADFEVTPSPALTESITATIVDSPTPLSTPSLFAEQPTAHQVNESNADNNQSDVSTQAVSTPSPNTNDDNGNHYGLTPKPVRTIDSGNNNNPQDNQHSGHNK